MAFSASSFWVPRLKAWPVPGILASGEFLATRKPFGDVRVGAAKSMTFLRSSVMLMPAMMASYFLALSAGMMPSQSWATISHFTFMRRAEIVGEIDLEAFELAAGAGEVPRRIGAFGGDLDGLFLGRGAADGEGRAEESEADSLKEIHLCSLIFERLDRRPGVEPGGRLGPLRVLSNGQSAGKRKSHRCGLFSDAGPRLNGGLPH